MLVLSAFLLGAFILHSVTRDIDDDDDKGDGMMVPALQPTQ